MIYSVLSKIFVVVTIRFFYEKIYVPNNMFTNIFLQQNDIETEEIT